MEAVIGRRLVGFGVVNPMHFHERPFADTPLVLANFLGEHSWYDDHQKVEATEFAGEWVQYKLALGARHSGCTPRVKEVAVYYG